MIILSSKKSLCGLFIIFLIAIISISAIATIDASSIPGWIKNNAKWWSEGKISEADYISSLEYLLTHGIINMPQPIPQVTATPSSLKDEERAQSFRVTLSKISQPVSVNYFEKFEIVNSKLGLGDIRGKIYSFDDKNRKFFLESLPSANKKGYYEFVSEWMKIGSSLNKFDVSIEVLDGRGMVIQVWEFTSCEITDYGTYLQDIINIYQFSGVQDSEIRDRTYFSCSDINLKVP